MRRKEYGKTFLTKPRFKTTDEQKAMKSFWIWGTIKEYKGTYVLTILGMINSLLGVIPGRWVLVADTCQQNGTRYITKYSLTRKWW